MGYVQVSVAKSLLIDENRRSPWGLRTHLCLLLRQAMKPPGSQGSQSTYTDLLSVVEEMGKEIRPTYAGSKSAMESLKRGIIHAWALVRECLAETERNART